MRSFRAISISAVLALVPFSGAIGQPGHRTKSTGPRPAPSGWAAEVTNPYFPLQPGTTFHYTGETDGIPSTDDMEVTKQKKVILGVSCTVVHDRVYTNGVLSEDTFDWYAPRYQWKHTEPEVAGWFRDLGFERVETLGFPVAVRARRPTAGDAGSGASAAAASAGA